MNDGRYEIWYRNDRKSKLLHGDADMDEIISVVSTTDRDIVRDYWQLFWTPSDWGVSSPASVISGQEILDLVDSTRMHETLCGA